MSVISGIAGASAQKSSAKKAAGATENAAQIGADALLNMFNKNLELQKPYHEAGVRALGDLEGGVSPSGDAGQYIDKLSGMDLNLPEFDYSFDPEDPAYKFKLDESQKAIDAASAARGNYNSRAAINAISDAQRAITADEVTSQFQRQKDIYGLDTARLTQDYNTDYGRTLDLFNAESKLGGLNYQSLIDLVKIGQGSAASAGSGATATGQGLDSTYSNMGNSLANAYIQSGNATANMFSGIGATGINAASLYAANKGDQWSLFGNAGKNAAAGYGASKLPADWANYVI